MTWLLIFFMNTDDGLTRTSAVHSNFNTKEVCEQKAREIVDVQLKVAAAAKLQFGTYAVCVPVIAGGKTENGKIEAAK